MLTSNKHSDVQCLLGFHTVALDRKTYLRRAWVGGWEGGRGAHREGGVREGKEGGTEGKGGRGEGGREGGKEGGRGETNNCSDST